MQLGMIGLGRMGGNMVRRLLKGGHQCIVYNRSANVVAELVKEKAIGTTSLPDFVKKLSKPRAVWLMAVPTGVVDNVLANLSLPHSTKILPMQVKSPAACPTSWAKAAGRSRRPSTRACRRTCYRRRSTNGSARAEMVTSPTSSFPPCVTSLAATSKSRPQNAPDDDGAKCRCST